MTLPWGYGPKQFEIPAGTDVVVRLDVPHRGLIQVINLQQQDGADNGVFEIYDSEAAAKVLVGSSSSDSSGISGAEPAAHSVTAGAVVISNGAYRANNLRIPYINRDGSPTNGIRRLWMRMVVEGAGNLTFSLSMVIEPVQVG